MKELTPAQEKEVTKQMAKEFLECRLGVDATEINVHLLAAHILQFEKEVAQCALQKRQTRIRTLVPVKQQQTISRAKACHA